MNIELLNSNGIDYDKGLYRFMNNASLYEGLLKEFLKTHDYKLAKSAKINNEYDKMINHLNKMKITTKSLELCKLYEKTIKVIAVLESGQYDDLEELYNNMQEEYEKTISLISQSMN